MQRWLRTAVGRSSCSPKHYKVAYGRLTVSAAAGGNGASDGSPHRLGSRALSAISSARLFNFNKLGTQLGGTLVVDDASHKEEVQKVRKNAGQGCSLLHTARVEVGTAGRHACRLNAGCLLCRLFTMAQSALASAPAAACSPTTSVALGRS